MEYNSLGYRFRPTDEEIILHFLEGKMQGIDFPVHVINDVDICNFEPWELPEKSALPDDEEWYFFWVPNKKLAKGDRTSRTTKAGYWKVSGRDRSICDNEGNEVIGTKKILVYFKGRGSNAIKTNWVIHEFHSNNASAYEKPFVLCRLKGNLDDQPQNYSSGESSGNAASGS